MRACFGVVVLFAVVVVVAACGSRTRLRGEDLDARRTDAGDAPNPPDVPIPVDVPVGFDVRVDVPIPVDVTPRVDVACPAPVRGRQTETAALSAMASSNLGLPLAFDWQVERRPMGSTSVPAPANGLATRFLFDTGGEWQLRFTARDPLGNSASCTVRVAAEPAIELLCPNDQSNYQGATVPLVATARSNFGRPVTFRWTTLARPATSATAPVPDTAPVASLLLDQLGDWRLQLVATDSAGLTSSCVTQVHADPDVIVTCPADVHSAPFATITLAGTASSRLGLALTYRWEIVDRPITSTASIPSPSTLSTPFTFDVAGNWTYRLTATNPRGNAASCTTRALAASSEAVRVEIVWNVDRACVGCNPAGGDQDIDLHLTDVSRSLGHWASGAPGDSDCYYANCVCGAPGTLCPTERLDWPPGGRANNPQLDVDHVSDLPGPENINVVSAEVGAQFDVGVHFYSSHGHSTVTALVARVYCAGAIMFESEVVPFQESASSGSGEHNLWRVGRITVTAGGCTFARCGSPGMLTACIRPEGDW
jgi:hypothetical protein